MSPLIALHVVLMTLNDRTRAALATRRQLLLDGGRDAGLTTLEITIIGLGLFLIAGIAVVVLTSATQGRLDRIK